MKLPPIDRHTANLPVFIFVAAVGFGAVMIQSYYQEQARIEREQTDALAREKRVAEWRAKAKAKEEEPASNWYVIRSINLDDFVEGNDPPVVFDSDAKRSFIFEWNIQAHSVDAKPGFPPLCTTGNSSIRTPNDNGGLPVIVPWSQVWKRNPCHLGGGAYLLKFHGTLHINGYPDKEVERVSNIFKILPKGAQLYIEPEQAQKLENIQ